MSDNKINNNGFFMSNDEIEEINRRNGMNRQDPNEKLLSRKTMIYEPPRKLTEEQEVSSNVSESKQNAMEESAKVEDKNKDGRNKPDERPVGSKHSKEPEKRWFGRKNKKNKANKAEAGSKPDNQECADNTPSHTAKADNSAASAADSKSAPAVKAEKPSRDAKSEKPLTAAPEYQPSQTSKPEKHANNEKQTAPEKQSGPEKTTKPAKPHRFRSFSRNFIIVIILLTVLLCVGGYKLVLHITEPEAVYAAGTTSKIKVYTQDAANNNEMVSAGKVTRGSRLIVSNHKYTEGDETYRKFKSDEGEDLYIKESNLANTLAEAVQEEKVWVRTSATIYSKADGPAIKSFAPKGSSLIVAGYDKLLDNGVVNKYAVEYTNSKGKTVSGYVYGKYMTDTEKKALKKYNKHDETKKAKKDKFRFDLYGGKAENLDYYPVERPEIKGNEFCDYARAMYINSYAAVHPDAYIDIIKNTDCNAVVIDLKDGPLAYKSEVAKEWSPTSYKNAYASIDDLKKGVQKYQEAGVYTIGRIVVFNDPYYAADHPEDCIKYGSDTSWPSAYSRDVWEYNVRLAQEAIREFGFSEIQFDYVRFPEATYEMSKSGAADFRNKYKEEKAQAVQNFCYYASDQIHESGAYFSIDVFGESVYGYVTAYGQYWPALTNVVDAISAMPYTDHTGGEGAWKYPYKTLNNWGKKAKKQQDRIKDPAVPRTWITGYNTPYWAPTENYDAKALKNQIKGLEDAGIAGGFIPWNAMSDAEKYNQYKSIWKE